MKRSNESKRFTKNGSSIWGTYSIGSRSLDAHLGYGLPIGGVLGTENAVIPYAVGVDIACRMKLSVFDIPLGDLVRKKDRLAGAISAETRFGIGASFKQKRLHDVMDANWDVSPVTHRLKDKAWSQLGTSGSGNRFVAFGTFELQEELNGLKPGTYVALLSHSGSRGTGSQVCDRYSKLAMEAHPEFLVRGKGSAESLNSASHGAGRVMSRKRAMQSFEWGPVKKLLKEKQITLMSAGLDEVPMVYKDIHQVMAAQSDLVEILGQFEPRIVKMAPYGERPED